MHAQDIFEQHGLSFDSTDQAMESLNDLDIVELWDLAEALIPDNSGIESTGNEDSDSLILRTALISALENGAESLSQKDFDRARDHVSSLEDETPEDSEVEATAEGDETPDENAAMEAGDEDTTNDVEASDGDDSVATEDQPKRRGRRPSSEAYTAVKTIVEADPDLVKDEVVEQAQSQTNVDVSESTLVLYFYKARKELGLATNGTRGRPRSDKWSDIVELVRASGDANRATVITQISEQFDVAESTAINYYHKAHREISGE